MKPTEAKEEFERFVAEAGATVSEFKPIDAIRLMLDFYQQERAEGCDLPADGDMLLFQWGTNDVDEEENTTQLSLTCYFPPTPELEALKSGSKWCASPDELAGFEYFIGRTPAYKAVGKSRPENVALTYGPV